MVCAIDDVAITQTMLVAMATLIGTPKARLSIGTMMMPPPTPSMLPKTPGHDGDEQECDEDAHRPPPHASSPAGGRRRRLTAGAALLAGEPPLHGRARRAGWAGAAEAAAR